VGLLERKREIKGKASREWAFYISRSVIVSAQALATAARRHWEIGNSLIHES
jgi:hypothetical protein